MSKEGDGGSGEVLDLDKHRVGITERRKPRKSDLWQRQGAEAPGGGGGGGQERGEGGGDGEGAEGGCRGGGGGLLALDDPEAEDQALVHPGVTVRRDRGHRSRGRESPSPAEEQHSEPSSSLTVELPVPGGEGATPEAHPEDARAQTPESSQDSEPEAGQFQRLVGAVTRGSSRAGRAIGGTERGGIHTAERVPFASERAPPVSDWAVPLTSQRGGPSASERVHHRGIGRVGKLDLQMLALPDSPTSNSQRSSPREREAHRGHAWMPSPEVSPKLRVLLRALVDELVAATVESFLFSDSSHFVSAGSDPSEKLVL